MRWDLRYRSSFGATLADWSWIGFSRTAHSDAVFSGEIELDGRDFGGEPLGFGLQGHNCGFRHRRMWNWTHGLFRDAGGDISTFEALEYEIPFGLRYRKAFLWHNGRLTTFRKFRAARRSPENLQWIFTCSGKDGTELRAEMDGSGTWLHRLPYVKTDCSGTFEVANNSLARARIAFTRPGEAPVEFATDFGAVLEMVG